MWPGAQDSHFSGAPPPPHSPRWATPGDSAGWCPLCLRLPLLNFTLGSVISPTTSSLFD